MKLRTRFSGYYEVNNVRDVMVALTQLGWAEDEDTCLVCDAGDHGFVQVCKWRPGQYIVEWCDGNDASCPRHGLRRAHYPGTVSEIVEFGHQERGQFNLYQSDLLALRDVLDILGAFCCGRSCLSRVGWRDLSPEMRKFVELRDQKHERMSLCE